MAKEKQQLPRKEGSFEIKQSSELGRVETDKLSLLGEFEREILGILEGRSIKLDASSVPQDLEKKLIELTNRYMSNW